MFRWCSELLSELQELLGALRSGSSIEGVAISALATSRLLQGANFAFFWVAAGITVAVLDVRPCSPFETCTSAGKKVGPCHRSARRSARRSALKSEELLQRLLLLHCSKRY